MGFGALSYPLHISTSMSMYKKLLTTVTCQSLHEKLRIALPESNAVISQQHLILSKTESVAQPVLLGSSFAGETPFPINVHVHR